MIKNIVNNFEQHTALGAGIEVLASTYFAVILKNVFKQKFKPK